jgi:hypothetical protein
MHSKKILEARAIVDAQVKRYFHAKCATAHIYAKEKYRCPVSISLQNVIGRTLHFFPVLFKTEMHAQHQARRIFKFLTINGTTFVS